MAEQPLAGPAPAPALVFTVREPSELLKQRYGENEEFLEVSYLPPSLAGAFAGGYKDTEGKIVFPRSRRTRFVSYVWYLGSNIVTSSGSLQDTFLYLLVSHSAPIVRAQDKGARIFGVGVGCVAIRLLNFFDG